MRNLLKAKATRLAGRGRREHSLERRRKEHEERVTAWQALSPEEQWRRLPDVGAEKQKKRLLSKMKKES